MKKLMSVLLLTVLSAFGARPTPSEITVKLQVSINPYVEGERIRVIVDVANRSREVLDVGSKGSPDVLMVELYEAAGRSMCAQINDSPFTAPFMLRSAEGQKLEVFLANHYDFSKCTRYLARAVLIHNSMRYESEYKSFDVVPGLHVGHALQMFKNVEGLNREFELVHTGRDHVQHLFLKAHDGGKSSRKWRTTDLGAFMRVTEPKLSIMPSGEVVVLHRMTQDKFVRSVFWSLPEVLEFHEHELMSDPDVAGAERVKQLYKEAGGVEPVKKVWWKFW